MRIVPSVEDEEIERIEETETEVIIIGKITLVYDSGGMTTDPTRRRLPTLVVLVAPVDPRPQWKYMLVT